MATADIALAPSSNNTPRRTVPLLDVVRELDPLRDELLAAVARVIDTGRFVMGDECEMLEKALAERCQVRHAVGCASGSDALLLALMALGIGPGDEVILPSFTFFATASAVTRVGATPIFADISPETFLLDTDATAALITERTRAILPVHLFGQCAPLSSLKQLAAEHGVPVVEDCAQSSDACSWGQPAGSVGAVGCFSVYPTKNLGGCGDGGLVTTNDTDLAARLRLLRAHGMQPRYVHHEVGINSRLDTLQAALLLVKLPYLDGWNRARRENARRYDELLQQASLEAHVRRPRVADHSDSVWNQYTVRVLHGRRDGLRQFLAQSGIGTEVYYPLPLHQQPCFAHLAPPPRPLPHTEQAAAEVLSLPIFPALTAEE